jgi:subtilisin-like proprotein convertase family protein
LQSLPTFERLEDRTLLSSATLTTGIGDASLSVTIDGGGEFRSAIYDPVGPTSQADTTFQSSLYFREGPAGVRQEFGNGVTDPLITVNATNTQATGTFTVNALTFDLVQIVSPLFDGAGVQNGALLTQRYQMTNTGATTVDFELVRYLDGDLLFDGTLIDGGGRLTTPSGTEVLFETDAGGGGSTATTFVGITGTGGSIPAVNRFEIDAYSGLETRIANGTALDGLITGDANADGFVDLGSEYDVTLGLRNVFSLAPGASDTYTTLTVFGTGAPNQLDFGAGGSVFNDLDGNGIKDPGETPLPNWTIFADQNRNGVLDSGSQSFVSTDTPKFLRDTTITNSTIDVAGFTGDVTDVTVNLDITHAYDNDLTVTLIAPSGNRVKLFSQVGGSLDNFTNTTLDDQATTLITAGFVPFTGSFRPMEPLSRFKSEPPNGTWTLEVNDVRSRDEGVLNNWSMTIATSENFAVSDNSGNFNLRLPNAGIYFITEVPQLGWTETTPGGSGSVQVLVLQNQNVTGLLFGNRASNAPTPVLHLPTGPVTYTENSPAVVIDPGMRVEDANTSNFNGGSLTVSLTANGTVNDRVEILNQGTGVGQISISGATVRFDGTNIGTFTGGNGATPLVITLNGNATSSITTALLRAITFRTLGENPSTLARTVQISITDGVGGLTSVPVTTTVNVVAVNDPPVNVLPGPITVSKNNSVTISGVTAVAVSDVDALDTDLVQVQLAAQDGTLSLSTTNGLTFSFTDPNGTGVGSGTGDFTMTFRGTRTSVNAALNGLVFAPLLGFAGSTTIAIVTNDLGTTGTGGALTDVDSLGITVINLIPTLTAIATLSGAAEDTDFAIAYAILATAANEADANSDVVSFRVDSLGIGSTLTKNGFAVIPGLTTLGIGESLVWRGPANTNGVLAGFAVRAFDGSDVSSPPVVVNIDVSPQPDAPTLSLVSTLPGAFINVPAINNIPFNITYSQLTAAANEADVDGDSLNFRVESIGAGSTLEEGFGPVIPGNSQLSPGETWTWTSSLGASGDTAAFTIVAIDPGGLTSGTPITVLVNVIPNQAPTLTSVGTLAGGLRNIPFPIGHTLLASVSNEADQDNDPISFRIETLTQGTLTKNGVAVVPGTTTVAAGEAFLWTPPAGVQGTAVPAFTIVAFDGFRPSATPVQVNVELVNLAPTFTFVPTLTGGQEDLPYPIPHAALLAQANEADQNNDPISFRIGQLGVGTLTVNGLPVVAGSTMITASDTATWTPPANLNGVFPAFSIRAFDGDLLSSAEVPVNISLIAVPDSPTLTTINTISLGFESLPFEFTYGIVATAANENDADGDVVSFRVESVVTGTLTKNGLSVVAGVTLLGPGEKLVWTPPAGTSGVVAAFTVRATDGTRAKVLNVTNPGLLTDGDRFTITTGNTSVTFEFENTVIGNGVTLGNIAVNFTTGQTAAEVAATIQAAINGSSLNVIKPVPLSGSQVTIDGMVFNPTISTTLVNGSAMSAADGGPSLRALSANPVTVNLQVSSLQATELLRAYNRPLDYHFFTTSRAEFENAVNHGYEDEAASSPSARSGFAVTIVQAQGSSAIHRLRNPNSGRHYYTNNTAEKNYLASIGWIYEKDEGFIFAAPMPNTVEVFKLYNRSTGAHVYVDSSATRDAILGLSPTWERHTSLGFAFHVNPSGSVNLAPAGAPARSAPSRGDAPDEVLTRPLSAQLPSRALETTIAIERNELPGQMANRAGLVTIGGSVPSRVNRQNSLVRPSGSELGDESTQSHRLPQPEFPSSSALDDFWTTVGRLNGELLGVLTDL